MEKLSELFSAEMLESTAKALFREERKIKRLDGWFIAKELAADFEEKNACLPKILKQAKALEFIAEKLPIFLSDHAVFAGTERDAFAKSYALINPSFEVKSFNGYCDPTAVFHDIEPNDKFTAERIQNVRNFSERSDYVKALRDVYRDAEKDTAEVTFFIEQVTGHVIPDFKPLLKFGVRKLIADIDKKLKTVTDEEKRINYEAMKESLSAVVILANRYADLAEIKATCGKPDSRARFELLAKCLRKVPEYPAENLYEAIQSFMLGWQIMCLEQAPNPFAFSVGNADRIFEPYQAMEDTDRQTAAGLFKHLLVFYNVGDRSWAISQNLMIGGKDVDGRDLTNPTSYALLDAYYAMNLPQPILSVKLHKNTPNRLYEELGRFFFTPGCLTPSLFNDDSVFRVLEHSGVEKEDLPNYSIAGCQEPLIMGKDNGNTTNSWLNMPKILELILNDGKSLITGKKIGKSYQELGCENLTEVLKNIREIFYRELDEYLDRMVAAANSASCAISHLTVPFLSCFMGGIESGYDMRDTVHQGTKYNGSGCLIHGLTVMADCFAAIDKLLSERPDDAERMLTALRNNFSGDDELREFLLSADKCGNNLKKVDDEAAYIADKVSDMVRCKKNYLGNPFRADWSSPTTHLLYGYWVGATPDGRKAREQLSYGIDPLFGEATNGLGFRLLSAYKLPFLKFNGGYASHIGLNPKYFRAIGFEERGLEFKMKIIDPIFFNPNIAVQPFYVYFNITTPETLRKVLENPKKYAPGGVYIMRIHGTFVNFLDLLPEIQQDIIKRLDLGSTSC